MNIPNILVEVAEIENGTILSVLRPNGRRPQVGDILKLSGAHAPKWTYLSEALGDGVDQDTVACVLKGIDHEDPPPSGTTLYFE